MSADTFASRVLSGGSWAFVALALLSFLGGLFLARVSHNPPDHFITVAAHPPEMLYAKPPLSDTGATAVSQGRAAAAENTPPSASVAQALTEGDHEQAESHHAFRREVNADSELLAIAASVGSPLPDATANLAAAMRFGAITIAQNSGRGGGDVTVTYDAVELPSVPEPAAGSIVAIALGGLIGWSGLVRKRHRSRN